MHDPLPKVFQTGAPGIGGVIKARPEDFVVDEVPLYDPAGSGEHLYLRVEKVGVSHGELIGRLRRHFGVTSGAIGFAGMKDKHAVTRQTVSIHMPGDPRLDDGAPDLGHERITVLWARRHTNRLRLGHLAGNRFVIRVREVDPSAAPAVRRRLEWLRRDGAANYFGVQRFGYRCNNHRLGAMLLCGDYEGVLAELLGTGGTPFPAYQLERRELFEAGRYAEAAAQWTPADRNELAVCNALRDGRERRAAVLCAGHATLSFWVSALQSAVFNQVLDRRLEDGLLLTLLDGDLAWKHDNGACFRVTPGELEGPALAERLNGHEISPSGPLWGRGMTQPHGAVLAREREALAETGLGPESFDRQAWGLKGARRPLRVPVCNPSAEGGADEHGPYVEVAFDLPSGAYATVVMREIMKEGTVG